MSCQKIIMVNRHHHGQRRNDCHHFFNRTIIIIIVIELSISAAFFYLHRHNYQKNIWYWHRQGHFITINHHDHRPHSRRHVHCCCFCHYFLKFTCNFGAVTLFRILFFLKKKAQDETMHFTTIGDMVRDERSTWSSRLTKSIIILRSFRWRLIK